MKDIYLTVIGSGSTYCPELIDGFLKAKDSLNLKKVSFMDISASVCSKKRALIVKLL